MYSHRARRDTDRALAGALAANVAAGHPYAPVAVASARPPGSPAGFPPTYRPIADRFS
jgi:hypothetical protein